MKSVPIINPTRNQISNLFLYPFKAQQIKTNFKIPGSEEYFSESEFGKGFFQFEVLDQNNKTIRLQTYREKQIKFPEPKAIIIFQHGINSHLNRLAHIAKYLANQGYECVGFDQRGFGKSITNINKGLIQNYQIMTEDSILFLKELENYYPKRIKKFMLGESMGGMNTLLTSLKSKNLLDGLILLAPAIQLANKYAKYGLGFSHNKDDLGEIQILAPNIFQLLNNNQKILFAIMVKLSFKL